MLTDVNAELFKARVNEKITVAMASTLNLDGTPDDGQYNPNQGVSKGIIGILYNQYDFIHYFTYPCVVVDVTCCFS